MRLLIPLLLLGAFWNLTLLDVFLGTVNTNEKKCTQWEYLQITKLWVTTYCLNQKQLVDNVH